jgi:hypothetical protein
MTSASVAITFAAVARIVWLSRSEGAMSGVEGSSQRRGALPQLVLCDAQRFPD